MEFIKGLFQGQKTEVPKEATQHQNKIEMEIINISDFPQTDEGKNISEKFKYFKNEKVKKKYKKKNSDSEEEFYTEFEVMYKKINEKNFKEKGHPSELLDFLTDILKIFTKFLKEGKMKIINHRNFQRKKSFKQKIKNFEYF
jgi:hypothetical protein